MLESRWQKSCERRTLTSQLTPTRRKKWYRGMIKHMLVSQEGSGHLTKMNWKTSISGGYTYVLCISSSVTLENVTEGYVQPCPNEKCLAIKHHELSDSMLTTHFRVWTICLMVFNKIWTTSNFCSYLVKYVWYHSVQHHHVWSLNNVWSPVSGRQTFPVWTVPVHHLEALFVFVDRT